MASHRIVNTFVNKKDKAEKNVEKIQIAGAFPPKLLFFFNKNAVFKIA